MKGQKVISEIMLFAVGVLITAFVIFNYQGLQDSLSDLVIKDGLLSVSDLLSTGIVKVSETNSIIRLKIPTKIAGSVYMIEISNDNIVLTSFEKPSINITKQLINITQSHNITILGNVLFSPAGYVQIQHEGGNITISKWGR